MIKDFIAEGDLQNAGTLHTALEAYKEKTIDIIWLRGLPHMSKKLPDIFIGGDPTNIDFEMTGISGDEDEDPATDT